MGTPIKHKTKPKPQSIPCYHIIACKTLIADGCGPSCPVYLPDGEAEAARVDYLLGQYAKIRIESKLGD